MTLPDDYGTSTPGPCGHPLVDRLVSEAGYPHLTTAGDLAAFLATPGTHCLLLPGEVARNLETPDVAVILPELHRTFRGAFDCAVAQDAAELEAKAAVGVHKTPSLVFFCDGDALGAIPKVRDWDDYMARIPAILGLKRRAS